MNIAGYLVPINAVVDKLLPNLNIDRGHLEDFCLHYAMDRWLFKHKYLNVRLIVVPSNLDDFETLQPNKDPEVLGVLFIFITGWSVGELNVQEPTKETGQQFS